MKYKPKEAANNRITITEHIKILQPAFLYFHKKIIYFY